MRREWQRIAIGLAIMFLAPLTAQACFSSYDCPNPPYSQPWILFCSGANSCTQAGDTITCDGQTQTCWACEEGPPWTCDSYGWLSTTPDPGSRAQLGLDADLSSLNQGGKDEEICSKADLEP